MARQKEESILRFNVATHLCDHIKFQRFSRAINEVESVSYRLVIRFWEWVSINRAMSGAIENVEPEIIAKFCWYEGDAKLLIDALLKSEFLDIDLKVHDWIPNQPLVANRLKQRGFNERIPNQLITNNKPIPNQFLPAKVNKSKVKQTKAKNTYCESELSDPFPEFELWINLCSKVQTEKLLKLTPDLKTKILIRRKEPLFDFPLICISIEKLFAAGRLPGKEGWAPRFKWLCENEQNYVRILEQGLALGNGSGLQRFSSHSPPAVIDWTKDIELDGKLLTDYQKNLWREDLERVKPT